MKKSENFRRVSYFTKEGIGIWYLLACEKQEEQEILTKFKGKLPKRSVEDIFVLTFDRMRRYEGAWHLERQLLFPGYVFLESDHEGKLLENLKELEKLEGLKKTERYGTISGQKNNLFRMGEEEEQFLKKLCGVKHHLEMSRGIIREGNAQITEGPLKGLEKRINRIDRHKRLARIEMMIKPDYHYISAGLEITEKII